MKPIRASEIGAYLYCQRAWWYQKNGVQPHNQSDLAAGSQLHARHGRSVFLSGGLRLLAYGFLLLALVLATVAIVMRLI